VFSDALEGGDVVAANIRSNKTSSPTFTTASKSINNRVAATHDSVTRGPGWLT